jgi:CBS domain-containing protein
MTVDLKTHRVKDVMSTVVITVGPDDTVQDALFCMAQYRVTSLPVTDAKNRCVGILSTTDLVDPTRVVQETLSETGRVQEQARSWLLDRLQQGTLGERKVEELMTTAVTAISREMSIIEAAGEMLRHRVHHLPVVDEHQRLLGIISTMDLLDAFVQGHTSAT